VRHSRYLCPRIPTTRISLRSSSICATRQTAPRAVTPRRVRSDRHRAARDRGLRNRAHHRSGLRLSGRRAHDNGATGGVRNLIAPGYDSFRGLGREVFGCTAMPSDRRRRLVELGRHWRDDGCSDHLGCSAIGVGPRAQWRTSPHLGEYGMPEPRCCAVGSPRTPRTANLSVCHLEVGAHFRPDYCLL